MLRISQYFAFGMKASVTGDPFLQAYEPAEARLPVTEPVDVEVAEVGCR